LQKLGARNYLYPVLTGIAAGAAAIAGGMLLAALIAAKTELALSAYPMFIWGVLILGGITAGAVGTGMAGQLKLVCGMVPAVILWMTALLLVKELTAAAVIRDAVIVAAGFIGCLLSAGKRRINRRKPRHRARPRRGSV